MFRSSVENLWYEQNIKPLQSPHSRALRENAFVGLSLLTLLCECANASRKAQRSTLSTVRPSPSECHNGRCRWRAGKRAATCCKSQLDAKHPSSNCVAYPRWWLCGGDFWTTRRWRCGRHTGRGRWQGLRLPHARCRGTLPRQPPCRGRQLLHFEVPPPAP